MACFRRIESGSLLKPLSSHVKLAKDKVEGVLTLICMNGDHSMYDLHFYFLSCLYARYNDGSIIG